MTEKAGGTVGSKRKPLFIYYDCEAANGKLFQGDIIEIAARCDPSVVKASFESLVHTSQELLWFAVGECGITKEDLLTQPAFPVVISKFFTWIRNVVNKVNKKATHEYFPVLCTHGGFTFDYVMLLSNMKRHNIKDEVLKATQLHFADTFELCKELKANNFEKLSGIRLGMDSLFAEFCPGKPFFNRHRAMGDVNAMVDIFSQSVLQPIMDNLKHIDAETLCATYQTQFSQTQQRLVLEEKMSNLDSYTKTVNLKKILQMHLTYEEIQRIFENCCSYMDFYEAMKDRGIDRKTAKYFASQFGAVGIQNQGTEPYCAFTKPVRADDDCDSASNEYEEEDFSSDPLALSSEGDCPRPPNVPELPPDEFTIWDSTECWDDETDPSRTFVFQVVKPATPLSITIDDFGTPLPQKNIPGNNKQVSENKKKDLVGRSISEAGEKIPGNRKNVSQDKEKSPRNKKFVSRDEKVIPRNKKPDSKTAEKVTPRNDKVDPRNETFTRNKMVYPRNDKATPRNEKPDSGTEKMATRNCKVDPRLEMFPRNKKTGPTNWKTTPRNEKLDRKSEKMTSRKVEREKGVSGKKQVKESVPGKDTELRKNDQEFIRNEETMVESRKRVPRINRRKIHGPKDRDSKKKQPRNSSRYSLEENSKDDAASDSRKKPVAVNDTSITAGGQVRGNVDSHSSKLDGGRLEVVGGSKAGDDAKVIETTTGAVSSRPTEPHGGSVRLEEIVVAGQNVVASDVSCQKVSDSDVAGRNVVAGDVAAQNMDSIIAPGTLAADVDLRERDNYCPMVVYCGSKTVLVHSPNTNGSTDYSVNEINDAEEDYKVVRLGSEFQTVNGIVYQLEGDSQQLLVSCGREAISSVTPGAVSDVATSVDNYPEQPQMMVSVACQTELESVQTPGSDPLCSPYIPDEFFTTKNDISYDLVVLSSMNNGRPLYGRSFINVDDAIDRNRIYAPMTAENDSQPELDTLKRDVGECPSPACADPLCIYGNVCSPACYVEPPFPCSGAMPPSFVNQFPPAWLMYPLNLPRFVSPEFAPRSQVMMRHSAPRFVSHMPPLVYAPCVRPSWSVPVSPNGIYSLAHLSRKNFDIPPVYQDRVGISVQRVSKDIGLISNLGLTQAQS